MRSHTLRKFVINEFVHIRQRRNPLEIAARVVCTQVECMVSTLKKLTFKILLEILFCRSFYVLV